MDRLRRPQARPRISGRPWQRALGAMAALLVALSIVALPLTPAGAQDETLPTGQYTVTIIRDEIPLDLAEAPTLIGQWVVTFADGGVYTLGRSDVGTLVEGTYEVEGDSVTITDQSGLMACLEPPPGTSPEVDISTATYAWRMVGDGTELLLETSDDQCALRRLILSTRPLTEYVVCTTEGIDLNALDADGTPASEEDEGPGINVFEEETPEATDDGATPAADLDPEAGVDQLLSQMTACWATKDPARVFPLLSEEFLNLLVESSGPGGTLRDVAGQLEPFLAVPIVWERAGELELNDDEDEASAVVALQIGNEESFVDMEFVQIDGVWYATSLFGEVQEQG